MSAIITKQKFLEMQEQRTTAKIKPTIDLIVEMFNSAIENEQYVVREHSGAVSRKGILFEYIVPQNVAVSFARELARICACSESELFSATLKQQFAFSGWGGIDMSSLSLKEIQTDQTQVQLVLQGYVYF